MMNHPLIDIRNMTVTLGHRTILSDATLSIPKGTFTAIIGPNGSGKSTFLKALCGLIPLKKGTISIKGNDISTYTRREMAQMMAFVSQRHEFPPDVTALDIVKMGRFPYRRRFSSPSKDDKKAVARALRILNMEGLTERPVQLLSGGEQQRAFLAMALSQETEIILLDEPTTYLDISYQREILSVMDRLCKEENMTIVAVVHDINQALAYATYTVVIQDGVIVAKGNTKEVITPSMMKEVFSVSAPLEETTRGKRFILY